MRKIDDIIIHCTATEAGHDYSVDQIRQWHKANGWKDIGYHYVIRLDGSVEVGRPIQQPGAHCRGHNEHSIGIAYVGGLLRGVPHDTRTPAQRRRLRGLVADLQKIYRCPMHLHHDYNPLKACPCFKMNDF